jgi:hypothetical protein
MAVAHALQRAEIQPGRVYKVRASDGIVYKALVWEARADNRYVVEFLEPLENKEAAKFELGDIDEKMQGDRIIGPYFFSLDDGTEQTYFAMNISNKAEVSIKEVDKLIGKLSVGEVQDFGQIAYTLVLTDPEWLGDKRIEINVSVPIEGLRRKIRFEPRRRDPADVSCSCDYD